MQARRGGGLRLVAMSATLDAAKFVTYFPGSKAAYLQVWALRWSAASEMVSLSAHFPAPLSASAEPAQSEPLQS